MEKQETYSIIADPRENVPSQELNLDGYICTGDILDYVPPPNEDPYGSIMDELVEDIEEVYKQGPQQILEECKNLDEDLVAEKARERYNSFFESFEQDLYLIFGNQDIPLVLESVREDYSNIHHVSKLDNFHGIDGFVADYTQLPNGVFSSEISEENYLKELNEVEEKYLVTHSLPSNTDLKNSNVEKVFASAREDEEPTKGDVVRLNPLSSGNELIFTP